MNEKCIGWLARDRSGWLFFYEYEPFKEGCGWMPDGGLVEPIDDDDYPQISWKDQKATKVEFMWIKTIKIID